MSKEWSEEVVRSSEEVMVCLLLTLAGVGGLRRSGEERRTGGI